MSVARIQSAGEICIAVATIFKGKGKGKGKYLGFNSHCCSYSFSVPSHALHCMAGGGGGIGHL